MNIVEVMGILGLILIVTGWGMGLREPPPPPKLTSLYALGSLLLTVYALCQGDPIFILLNAAATSLALLNLARRLRMRSLEPYTSKPRAANTVD